MGIKIPQKQSVFHKHYIRTFLEKKNRVFSCYPFSNIKNITCIKYNNKQRLQDQFIQKWANDIDNSSKGQIYKIYKENFGFEKYFSILTKKFWKPLIKFRTSNHRLPIETGRWYGIPLNDRSCTLCNIGKLADEFHFILECKSLSNLRKQFLPTRYCHKPNTLKFRELFTTSNIKTLKKLSTFILNIQDQVCCPA